MTTRTSLGGKISVLAKKCVALTPCMTNLCDSDLAIVRRHALNASLFRRISTALMTKLARVEVVFSAAPCVVEEFVS